MERLSRTVIQIEEAKRFITAGDLPRLALALILLDNAAEVMMHRIVEDEFGTSDTYGRMLKTFPEGQLDPRSAALRNEIASRAISARRQKAIRRNFDEKVTFLSEERDRLPRPIGRVLKHLHTYRNEAQHHDRVRPGSIRPAVLVLFDICTDLLVRLEQGSTIWGSDDDLSWLGDYGLPKEPMIAAVAVEDLPGRIAGKLRSGLSLETDAVRTALIEHLSDRLDGMDDNISAIGGLTSIGADRGLALKAVQYWGSHDRMMTVGDAEFAAFVPRFSLNEIADWRIRVEALTSIEDKMELFDRFAIIEDEFEPLEGTLEYVVSEIESAGDAQSDIERGV